MGRVWKGWYPLLAAAATVAAWAPGIVGKPVLDDFAVVVENPYLSRLWPPRDLFGADPSGPLRDRPLTAATFSLSWAWGGGELWAHHLVNIVVQAAAALCLYGVLRLLLLTGRAGERLRRRAPEAALAAAVVWGVHPLQSESVTYIAQRAESLAGLFYLLTLYLVLRGGNSTRPGRWYAAAVAACALAMAAKSTAVTAPLAVWCCLRVFSGPARDPRRRRLLYLGLAATWSIPLVLTAANDYPDIRTYTVSEYALAQPAVLLRYLYLAAVPGRLCLDYSLPPPAPAPALAALALIAVLLGATLAALLRRRPLGFAGAWFFLALLPTSGPLPLEDLFFEHRMYLALAAPAAVAASLGVLLFDRRRLRAAGVAVLCGAAAALIARSWARNRDYADPERIWRGCLQVNPDNPRAHNNLGNILRVRGRTAAAGREYRRALALDPAYADAAGNLAALAAPSDSEEGIVLYRRYLLLRPGDGSARARLIRLLLNRGRVEEAREALAAAPPGGNPAQENDLALAALAAGAEAAAETHWRRALEEDPESIEALVNLGALRGRRGDYAGARALLLRALEQDPASAAARENYRLLEEEPRYTR